ncbi:nucleoporin sonb like [Lecanosticta acicola]|uniref:Nucleoporin sonb like n=1 Tax=Lecanosticta acicola TaxID=111012 RepID=A0AAI8YZ64_9PEZI|nr:nucleoporin sonb like [Lecanosticta acicola]
MSFFGNNNTNTSTGFGGFGASNTGFGGSNNNTSSGGGLFGGSAATSGGFGSGGGFGANNTSSPFARPASTGFGNTTAATTSGGGLFGANTSTSGGFGGGGFGNSNQTSTGFGAQQNTGGSLFGQSKPATTGFGSTTTGSIFGGGGGSSNTGGGFGGSNTTSGNPFASNTGSTGFGASNTNTNASTGGFGGFGGANTAATTNNGTASVPFQPFNEKDQTSNQTSLYQSLTFQQPYQNKSFEELRVEDYLQGRRYGNANGQAGSFGQSTGFGGSVFGGGNTTNTSTGGSLFGGQSNTNTSTGFGANQPQTQSTSGFGSNTGSSLFGANKPAGGGLFGSNQTSGTATGGFGNTTSGSTGGLFGGGGTGFGASNQTQNSGGLFGNNQQQNKPAFGGFGASNNNTSTGFGGASNTGGGLFGSNTNNNTSTGGGLFGSNNQQPQQQQQSNPFGGSTNTGGGLFGGNQSKPATGGLFGSSTNTGNTGGGLFGSNNNQQQQQSGGLFGSNANNQQGGGLFGGNNQARAPAAGGLFGGSTSNTGNTGGSSLFGGNNQNKPAGGLFGGSLGQSNNNQQQNANSLFGGTSFGGQSQAPQQNQLHASLTMSPYGNDQLFSSVGQSSASVGPLVTPLHGARPAQSKAPSLLSSTRLNSPVYTPRASSFNRGGTYGLNYSSTLTTPGSAYSISLTPQQSSLLKPTGSLGSALSSKLAKSMSTSNLRGDGTPREGESLLRPTPGGGSRSFLKSGSMRKLTINRELSSRLFDSPSEQRQIEPARGGTESEGSSLKKRVSFDDTAERESISAPSESNALVRTEDDEAEEPNALFRAKPGARSHVNGTPEMQQVNGSPLSTVPENTVAQRSKSVPTTNKKAAENDAVEEEIVVGDYWTKPAIKDLKNMSRTQLSKIGKLTVGCKGLGSVDFGPCDLSSTNLDDICGKIVKFSKRSVTVYPDESTKPSRGQGLNVPATIHLHNSYPSDRHHRRKIQEGSTTAYERHVAQLKKLRNTEFVDYDISTATWTFRVQHFTTYGMEESDDDAEYSEEDADVQQASSGLSELPEDETMQSTEMAANDDESSQDDTFGHKKRSFPAIQVPGGFEESEVITYDYDDSSADEGVEGQFMMSGGLGGAGDDGVSTSKGGAVQPPSPEVLRHSHSSMAYEDNIGAVDIAEQMQDEPAKEVPGSFTIEEPKFPRSILKPTAGYSTFASPEKLATHSWEDQLHATISPKKRDRQALRNIQQSVLRESSRDPVESPFKRSMLGQSTFGQSAFGESYLVQKSAKKVGFGASTLGGSKNDLTKSQAFRTSMDIMNSLWAQEKSTKKAHGAAANGFENPYPKKPRLSTSSNLNEEEAAFHESVKPHFANTGHIIYSVPGSARHVEAPLMPAMQPLVGEHKEVRFARWSAKADELNTETLSAQKDSTVLQKVNGFPFASPAADTLFQDLETKSVDLREKAIWKLSDILFDTVVVACKEVAGNMSADGMVAFEPRLRKDTFAVLWNQLVAADVERQIALAQTNEEKALLRLTMNDIQGAAELLVAAKDFKLATLVAQLPGDGISRDMMHAQIQIWRDRNDWSDMSEPIRALYTLTAGEVCTVAGKNGPAEHRASTFSICERFGLDWKQSFGLRVFFGGYYRLEDAVEAYIKALQEGHEKVLPTPSWVQGLTEGEGREDTLLGLLRLSVSNTDLEALFDPKTVSGSAVDSRVAWQLATYLRAKGYAAALPEEKLDQLTLGFAAELEAANTFVTAVWVLLHLHNEADRRKLVADLLFRNAKNISDPKYAEADPDGTWERLADNLAIPEELLWRAKAQHARAEQNDAPMQAKFLLHAGAYDEAHQVLREVIGPQAVIEEEFDVLSVLINDFVGLPEEDHPAGWEAGGMVYSDFVTLQEMSTARKNSKAGKHLMERLSNGLQNMKNAEGKRTLEAMVAIVEMERVLKEEMRDAGVNMPQGHSSMMDVDGVTGPDNDAGMDAFLRYKAAMGVVA